jgi:nucleotide-binding universal stress UspA family protein
MTSLHHAAVVVGVDGSPDSHAAADYAATEASRRHLPLRLVHGLQTPSAYSLGTLVAIDLSTVIADLRAMLDAAAADLRIRYPRLEVTTEVTAGDPAGVLVEESRAATLVVVGSRGLGGIRGMLAGSVSAQVAAHAHAPVIVIRPPAPDQPEPDRPSIGVVVGVDGSPGSTAALEFAFDEAEVHGSPLVAVYAWSTPPTADLGPITPRHDDPVEAQRDADRGLAELLAGWQEKHPGVAIERRAVHSLNPLDTLLTEGRDAALIAVGPRGRGGFVGLLLGCVSDGLVRHAHRPVAVVHTRRNA